MSAKQALVTGATGAVGRELLRLLGAEGWTVLGLHRGDAARAQAARADWTGPPGSLDLRACDLADGAMVEALHASLPEPYCPDVLIHLAAPPLTAQPAHRTEWRDVQEQLDGVLKPVVLLTQPLLRRMLRRGHGRILAALSSVVLGDPPRGFTSYSTAKHALAGYLKCLAAEYAGRGIAVNVVSPGPMDTSQLHGLPERLRDQMRESVPGGNWVAPAAVARTLFWLAAEAGPEITGCNVPVTVGVSGPA